MVTDVIRNEMEFKESLTTYQRYLEKLNMDAKRRLESGKIGFLDKLSLNNSIKKRSKILETIGEIKRLDTKAHFSMDLFFKENRRVIDALNALPYLADEMTSKIISTYVSEESAHFETKRKEIMEARSREKELLKSFTPQSGIVRIDADKYKDLGKCFSESLSDLSVFDLKVNHEHLVVSNDDAIALDSGRIGLLRTYKNFIANGKKIEIDGLSSGNVDGLIATLITDSKNRIAYDKLKNLKAVMPKENEKTRKVIESAITYYETRINKTALSLNVDFNALKTKIGQIEEQERREKESKEKQEARKELFNKIALLSFEKAQKEARGQDTSLIDKQITELLRTDIGRTFDANDISKAIQAGNSEYLKRCNAEKNKNINSAYNSFKNDEENQKLMEIAKKNLALQGISPAVIFLNGDLKSEGVDQSAYETALKEEIARLKGELDSDIKGPKRK